MKSDDDELQERYAEIAKEYSKGNVNGAQELFNDLPDDSKDKYREYAADLKKSQPNIFAKGFEADKEKSKQPRSSNIIDSEFKKRHQPKFSLFGCFK